jgi:hypothetical protein
MRHDRAVREDGGAPFDRLRVTMGMVVAQQ